MDIKNLRIAHCGQCGGTGKTFNNVPGNVILNKEELKPINSNPMWQESCSSCNGTGHNCWVKD